MIIGNPRINHPFFYPHVLNRTGRLFDYGCGTGDNVRQLMRDGFSRPEIVMRPGVPDYVPHHEKMCILEFCTGKK
jgi:hypothetical protein